MTSEWNRAIEAAAEVAKNYNATSDCMSCTDTPHPDNEES